jgi:4-aminobutyrate aminotransferase/diaminobutyrate-pyruvate transaminase/4-aminobutyrate aminotransferase/(S)-3-amino-2-methylpropionate transaminase
MDLYPANSMTSTHTGNPVSCAAALASIELILNENLAGNAKRMGDILHSELLALQSRFPRIGRLEGKGLVAGVACIRQPLQPGSIEPDGDLAHEVVERSMEKGVLMFAPVGFGGATIKICPPLTITEEALRESLQAFGEAFEEAVAAHPNPRSRPASAA